MTYNIVFMGTPDFAVPSLDKLALSGHTISLVVTQPDRPKGRGRKLTPPPVKTTAIKRGLEVFQPASIKDEAIVERLHQTSADFFIVVAFGQILPQSLLALPKIGAINVHASLLPKYRGSAPIQWAIINGEEKTGVTTMLMDKGMDTGNILLVREMALSQEDTAATVHDRLAALGADLLMETLDAYVQNTIQPKPQDHTKATYAPLLQKNDGRIQWEQPAKTIAAFVRGMNPWPGAFATFGKNRIRIFKAAPLPLSTTQRPGTVVQGFSDELRVATGDGILSILELQLNSGKRLQVKEFLRGKTVAEGTLLQ